MNNKKLIFIVSFLGLVIAALTFALFYFPAPDRSAKPLPASDWVTYTSDKYGFEIKHPADWVVAVNDEDFEPKINIYKKDETAKPPFIHHNNVTQVSFFPKGIGTEGVEAETATSTMKFGHPTTRSIDFLLEGEVRWATYATFDPLGRPDPWNDFGFVWASAEIKDPSSECVLDGSVLPIEKCDLGDRPTGAHIVLKGSINIEDRKIEERMLETFRML